MDAGMATEVPHLILIAGPNGAGKSTAAPILLRDFLGVVEFVNADAIAVGLSSFQPEKVAIHAGRIMLKRLHELAGRRRKKGFSGYEPEIPNPDTLHLLATMNLTDGKLGDVVKPETKKSVEGYWHREAAVGTQSECEDDQTWQRK
jgi:hypothetical protein